MFERLFKLRENNTNIKTEVMAGITSFITMAYILAVNPSILSQAGMDSLAVLMATSLSAAIACFCMALFANYPFALAPSMGVNAVFTYNFVLGSGISWQMALLAVFVEGIIFILLSFVNVREAIFNAIPNNLKYAISVGIGLFIAFIGFKDAGVVVANESTYISLCSFNEDFFGLGMTALLSLFGIIVISLLTVKRVKGSMLIGMAVTWIAGIILELAGIYQPAVSCIPQWSGYNFAAITKTAGQCFNADFSGVSVLDFAIMVITFLFMDMFDTVGTLIGVSAKADMLDENGRLPRIKGALFADAVGTTVGALLGTSTVSSYVESASGVIEGGRTGLTAVVVGVLFLVSLVFAPLFIAIPGFATASALVVVGVYMISTVTKIDFTDFSEAVPAFITIIVMPFTYSIADGILLGVISYVVINALSGKANRKKITPLMYILTILFIAKYMFL